MVTSTRSTVFRPAIAQFVLVVALPQVTSPVIAGDVAGRASA